MSGVVDAPDTVSGKPLMFVMVRETVHRWILTATWDTTPHSEPCNFGNEKRGSLISETNRQKTMGKEQHPICSYLKVREKSGPAGGTLRDELGKSKVTK